MPTTPAQQAHYQRNKDRYIAQARAKKDEYVAMMRQIKEASPCADCKQHFPAVCMDFDHREGEAKVADVSKVVMDGCWQKALAEMAKCDIVCANCHRLRTASRPSVRRRKREQRAPDLFDAQD